MCLRYNEHATSNSGGSRIFRRGCANSQIGIILQNFAEKGGGASLTPSLDLPMGNLYFCMYSDDPN